MNTYPTPTKGLTEDQLGQVYVEAKARILAKVDRLRPKEWMEGERWYPDAHAHCVRVGQKFGIDTEQVAYAIAVLSPMNGWQQNKADLVSVIETGEAGTFDSNVDKALDILENGRAGEDVAGGRKVRSFARNIAFPYQSADVTLDTHMLKALGLDTKYIARKGVYDAVSDAFRDVAEVHGITANALQAAMWIQQRGKAE